MQQTDEPNESQNEKIDAERDRLASNLAFLIVQVHRHDQQSTDESTNVTAGSDS